MQSAALADLGIPHGVTTRHGGVSEAPYASLNLGLHVNDDPARVLENRRRCCRALGFNLTDWVSGEQVHGAEVAVVGLAHKGRGALRHADSLPGIDGMITREPGILLAGYFADCVPLLFVNSQSTVVGLAHAGWRGTFAGIARRMVHALDDSFRVAPQDLRVWIGPSIGPCCYQVDAHLAARFRSAWGHHVVTDGSRLDLWAANLLQLEKEGVPTKQIATARTCTMCHTERFFSHRALGPATGRMAAFIGLARA